ncbi:hypothetical protein KUTeg_009687 [Tegillarca granosa]|uniref:Rieske domain-containing protein n=1 Tax=Tegillarca granosa TaxID=220873 RepID=A0ABQ9F4P9_TEGGR|nr:hypothetical protein KUTeg_009687 [Tegillarca granosa]
MFNLIGNKYCAIDIRSEETTYAGKKKRERAGAHVDIFTTDSRHGVARSAPMSSIVLTRAWTICASSTTHQLSRRKPLINSFKHYIKRQLHILNLKPEYLGKKLDFANKKESLFVLINHRSSLQPETFRYFTTIMGKGQSKSYDFASQGDVPSREISSVVADSSAIDNKSDSTNNISVSPQVQPAQSMSSSSSDVVEAVVCGENELKDGEMREVEVDNRPVLIVREEGKYYAVGSKCTHYGAPLVKGAHCNGRVRCPWHGACFNIKTGDIEDFPGLDSIPTFEVEVSDGKVKVKANKAILAQTKRQKSMCKADDQTKKSVLIVGGGPASVICAETLRQEGFTGQISIATREKCLPYDRPKLSKATSVNTEKKAVTFSDGSDMTYDSLLLATDDANFIAEKAAGKKVVIIGSSFIGMEVAAFLADKAESVSVVDIIKVPFQLVLGEKVGSVLQKLHEDNGIKFYFEKGIKQFEGEDGKVTEAILSDDTRLPADLCVLGVGVVPATDFLKDSGIQMSDRGFISVDKLMKTNVPDVYAAGDIVEFPLFTVYDKMANVQHWQMAHAHGRTAALSIMGTPKEIKRYGVGYDDIVVHGDLDAQKFVACYTKGDEVIAVSSLNFDPIVSQAAEIMASGKKILKSQILDSPDNWAERFSM